VGGSALGRGVTFSKVGGMRHHKSLVALPVSLEFRFQRKRGSFGVS